jgi:hypothetical protein
MRMADVIMPVTPATPMAGAGAPPTAEAWKAAFDTAHPYADFLAATRRQISAAAGMPFMAA